MKEKEEKKEKKKKKKPKMYFGKEVQQKIIEYQKEECDNKKEKIYTLHIYPAFSELVQNLVSVYGFKASGEDIIHLKTDCITFLFETIRKWNSEKGTKAFSYFNVVAKNWLTIQSRRLLKNANRSVGIHDQDSMTNEEKNFINSKEYIDIEAKETENKERFMLILQMIDYIESSIKEENDKKCVYAIKHIYNSIDNLDFLNKRAVFVYLRNISGLNSSELSSSLSNIRKIYRKVVGPNKRFDLN